MWLLDTVTISETTKPNANGAVLDWIRSQSAENLFTSVICLGEIRRGVERLQAGAKRARLRSWMDEDLPAWFGDRVLGVDLSIASLWGEITAAPRETVPVADALIAATAVRHGLTIVTRNTRHFAAVEAAVFDPWAEN